MLRFLPIVPAIALCLSNSNLKSAPAVEPARLTELAQAHAAKLEEIDELYLRWEELQC